MFPVENRQVLPAIPPLKLQLQPAAVLTQANYNQPMYPVRTVKVSVPLCGNSTARYLNGLNI